MRSFTPQNMNKYQYSNHKPVYPYNNASDKREYTKCNQSDQQDQLAAILKNNNLNTKLANEPNIFGKMNVKGEVQEEKLEDSSSQAFGFGKNTVES